MRDLNKIAINALDAITKIIGKKYTPAEALNQIVKSIGTILQYNNCMVKLLDVVANKILLKTSFILPNESIPQIDQFEGEQITPAIFKTGKSLLVRSIQMDPRFLSDTDDDCADYAFVGIPIVIENSVSGVLCVMLNATERSRLDEHERILLIIANLIGVFASQLNTDTKLIRVVESEASIQQRQQQKYRPDNIVGISSAMQNVFDTIGQVARWNTTVLIRGESGTGKELVSKSVHYQSLRSKNPFIKLNCAALPDNLLESELFGHEKGAFTGAVKQRTGRFELADAGTLFLDEVGDTSLPFQAKLLRVLQEGVFERLGGEKSIQVDVRIITATNIDLEVAVEDGRFREDLYYRLNVMPILLPPLRERREDIPLLVNHCLKIFSKACGRTLSADSDFLKIIQQCDFPGNVRELENCIHRAAVLSKSNILTANELSCSNGTCWNHLKQKQTRSGGQVNPTNENIPLAEIENERDRVIAALTRTGWVQAKAARLLDQTPRQIAYRIKKLNIELEHY